ncbi:MAG: acetyl-CoA carboxylase biotin carboxyl carrier protein subunit [Ignavibacteriales bacterium]|nr:acetyl-CoA carboxylase biotin carboxyl carrier protein subunit [Ignavibacteriales bacterium]MBK7979660.1 acetyl-CoA carboxylase biotin carboxyl carrier protein subunit [Ignavibacteriota bacterium]
MNEFVASVNSKKIIIRTEDFKKVLINDFEFNCDISKLSQYTFKVEINNKIFHTTVVQKNKESMLFLIDGKYIETSIKTLLEEKAENYLRNKESTTSIEQVYSPMPGLILKYYKNIDDEVKQGDPIILLEAMKMENEIHAPKSGIITNIHVKIGISVEKNQLLMSIK